MKPYNLKQWQDHIVDELTGEVIQEGTPVSATNLNNMETGILGADGFASVLIQQAMQSKRSIADLEGELVEVSLSNTMSYPFNNSETTVALQKARDTLNYRVLTEVLSSNGFVGDIEVYDKALNGFKIRYTGSATSATIKCFIQGGMFQ
ncbi:hypothetical protein P378_08500 [Desulforamulus profundi]|uniref:Uncharacterized protein n=2 Tax=Desulforamulus TaxID=2916693 RepID=A0A2C6MGL0_9FIRM|nr:MULTISPECIES: hypothetical protein [Desulforamulus]PHJ38536.1 hypothetical protein P378_08500 [Desulforamulus profundi]SHF46239.1 hypothetical protein SAMN02745133_02714 [Desulforamulus putei DSM 12395]